MSRIPHVLLGAALCLFAGLVHAAEPAQADGTRSGSDIYARFRAGLAEPDCRPDASARWRRHFAAAPKHMADRDEDVMPLFGYVVDALRESSLPTEFALIPFVESGYKPDARSKAGPAGLWQMIAVTARNHGVPIRDGYDGRLSPVDSTKAAVRYLKTLHGMFAGDWRLAAMAYNAGEYRILGALKRSGRSARNADPDTLPGVPDITRAYVRKLHALACVLDEADDTAAWREAIARDVPWLTDVELPAGTTNLDAWAASKGFDARTLRRINPVLRSAPVARSSWGRRVLAPRTSRPAGAQQLLAGQDIVFDIPPAPAGGRTHVVQRGDSLSRIARRYDVEVRELTTRNGLSADAILRPGMRLRID